MCYAAVEILVIFFIIIYPNANTKSCLLSMPVIQYLKMNHVEYCETPNGNDPAIFEHILLT